MATPSPGYAITVRVETPSSSGATSGLVAAVSTAKGVLTALDVVESHADRLVVDVTCNASDAEHADTIVADAGRASRASPSARSATGPSSCTSAASSRSTPKVPLQATATTSPAPTPPASPASAWPSPKNPEDARRLTIKRNTVAVVTDGSAVLGLGNIGPAAALPVMEGKAALFKQFAGVDAWPVCLDTQDTEEIIRIVKAHRPGLRRHQPRGHRRPALLRDRAPAARRARHPGLPRRPARHRDRRPRRPDQRAAGRRQADSRTSGSSSAASAPPGTPSSRCCTRRASRDIVACDRNGALHSGQRAPGASTAAGSPRTPTRDGQAGTLAEVLAGADVFIGVSAPDLLTGDDIATMADDAIVFALANPDPEVDPLAAGRHAAVVATGRSRLPEPDQQRARLPRLLPRLLDAGAREITDEVMLAAAARHRRLRRRRTSSTPATSSRRSSTRPSRRPSPHAVRDAATRQGNASPAAVEVDHALDDTVPAYQPHGPGRSDQCPLSRTS